MICLLLFNKPATIYTEFSLLTLCNTPPIWANKPVGPGCSWAKLERKVPCLDSRWMMYSVLLPWQVTFRKWACVHCCRQAEAQAHRYHTAALHFSQPFQFACCSQNYLVRSNAGLVGYITKHNKRWGPRELVSLREESNTTTGWTDSTMLPYEYFFLRGLLMD